MSSFPLFCLGCSFRTSPSLSRWCNSCTISGLWRLAGLVLVHIIYGIPITTLTFRNYYASIPNELVEAAKIDGAGMMRIYTNILLPISIPSFVVVLIWQFTQAWNDFLFSVVLTSPKNWTVTVALNNISGGQIVPWNLQMAGCSVGSSADLDGLYIPGQVLPARHDGWIA